MNMKFLPGLVFTVLLIACEISSIDYAVGEIELAAKTPTMVDDRPAIRLVIKNTGTTVKTDVVITVKAKKNQEDISTITIKLNSIKADEQVERYAVFGNLRAHDDYDFVTYAVSASNP